MTTPVETPVESSFFSDIVDGAAAAIFLKDDVTLNTFGKRLGAGLPMAIGSVMAYSRWAVKPALKALPARDFEAIKGRIPMAGITIGK